MVSQVLSFRQELTEVQARLRREIRFKAGDLNELVEYVPDALEADACPAIVIAVSRACGFLTKDVLNLATVIQFIFMADQVHGMMRDDEHLSEECRQFPVLVGDYLYGKFFWDLCKDHILKFLQPLAETIATMSQGGISRWLAGDEPLTNQEWLMILERERASLTGLAGRLSAELAGASQPIQDIAERLGSQLGLAWAACRQGLDKHLVENLLTKARHIVREFPDSIEFKPLYELVDFVGAELSVDEGELRNA